MSNAEPISLPPGCTIRPEDAADHEAIAEVVAAAFGSPAEARLVEALRAEPGYVPELALVAELDGGVVGHTMVTTTWIVDSEVRRSVAMLSPLAVAPAQQGKGIGSALVREVVARADALGHPAVILEGSPRFYGRLGFEPALAHGIHIHLPDWAPPEAAQVQLLSAYDPALKGTVVYPPPFDDLDA